MMYIVFILIVRITNIYILEMPLQHDAFERRASAQAAVRNQLKHTGHYLEFRPEDRVGLVSGRIRRWTMLSCMVRMMIAS